MKLRSASCAESDGTRFVILNTRERKRARMDDLFLPRTFVLEMCDTLPLVLLSF